MTWLLTTSDFLLIHMVFDAKWMREIRLLKAEVYKAPLLYK